MEIRIGTSGYSFEDWKGAFYPADIPRGKMLDFYVKYFSTVEINSTYYRIPHPAVMANIEKKTPKDFEFIVKTPDVVTHKRKEVEKSITAFRECLKPMEASGKLKGLMAQFPFSFKFSKPNLEYIRNCRQLLQPYPLFVEFRHYSWVNPETGKSMKEDGISFVAVDEPQLPGLLKPELTTTTDTAYIRLHGRNAQHWWSGGALRYDYDYSPEELQEWKEKVQGMEGNVNKTYIFFNNCHLGQAVKNAREMMRTLNL